MDLIPLDLKSQNGMVPDLRKEYRIEMYGILILFDEVWNVSEYHSWKSCVDT